MDRRQTLVSSGTAETGEVLFNAAVAAVRAEGVMVLSPQKVPRQPVREWLVCQRVRRRRESHHRPGFNRPIRALRDMLRRQRDRRSCCSADESVLITVFGVLEMSYRFG